MPIAQHAAASPPPRPQAAGVSPDGSRVPCRRPLYLEVSEVPCLASTPTVVFCAQHNTVEQYGRSECQAPGQHAFSCHHYRRSRTWPASPRMVSERSAECSVSSCSDTVLASATSGAVSLGPAGGRGCLTGVRGQRVLVVARELYRHAQIRTAMHICSSCPPTAAARVTNRTCAA